MQMEPNHVEKNGEEHLILFSLGEILEHLLMLIYYLLVDKKVGWFETCISFDCQVQVISWGLVLVVLCMAPYI